MHISISALEELSGNLLLIKDSLSRIYTPNAWSTLMRCINRIMSETAKEDDYQNLIRIHFIIPQEFKNVSKETKTALVKHKLSCEWECFVRLYKLLEVYTVDELDKVFDVFFTWYVFDMWYTSHRDQYQYVRGTKDIVTIDKLSNLGIPIGIIGGVIFILPHAVKYTLVC